MRVGRGIRESGMRRAGVTHKVSERETIKVRVGKLGACADNK